MKKEFIPYEQALALKELGFDEPCIMTYLNGELDKELFLFNHSIRSHPTQEFISAPLYQQAFRWFRDEHGMSGSIQIEHDAYQWSIFEEGETSGLASDNWDGTDYEEAELACLEKLIEMAHPNK
jgi:hypothetical protein